MAPCIATPCVRACARSLATRRARECTQVGGKTRTDLACLSDFFCRRGLRMHRMSAVGVQGREERRRQVTTLLLSWTQGNPAAMDDLLPLVYDELRRVARRHMAGEREGHLLQATALVNEAFLRLVDIRQIRWRDRTHFFAMASRLMRRVLVDHARARTLQKRGGAARHVTFDEG